MDVKMANAVVNNPGDCAGNYAVVLTTTYTNGKTVFEWCVTNTRPGNGKSGTSQDISHFNVSMDGGCADADKNIVQNWDHVLSAEVNTGTGWMQILPTPVIEPDPSIKECTTANLFKFDYGTKGGTPTCYRLTLLGRWGTAPTVAWFKSGKNTGCCFKEIEGIGCLLDEEACSLSQGYFFGNPKPWPAPFVSIGGKTYSETEGRAIWDASNAGGIPDSKKGFTQVTAIKLGGLNVPQEVLNDVMVIELWLSNIGKLNPTFLPNQTIAEIALYGDAAAAAGRIGDWINNNHCVGIYSGGM